MSERCLLRFGEVIEQYAEFVRLRQKGYLASYSSLSTAAHDANTHGTWASWTAGLGEGLQQLGFRADASSNLQKNWRFGADASGHLGGDLGVVGGKGGAGGGWSRDSSDQTATMQNLNTTASQQIVDSSLTRAISDYEKRHGVGSASQASQVELAHRAAEIAHQQFDHLLKAESDETANSRNANAALEKSGQVAPSKNVSDAFKGMEQAIEDSRTKLGPGFVR